MKTAEFIEKYKGSFPDIHGRTLWKTWDELAQDMEKDLKEYALQACKEQREICWENYRNSFHEPLANDNPSNIPIIYAPSPNLL